ncbi:conserved hypothetical protein [Desulfosarcina cetonica]|nr:conserved hypothetical protein [Desulfosarcina cetonica]
MDVGVDAAGGEDGLLTGNGFRAGTDDDVNARLHIGIAGLADAADAAVLDADIGLDDAPVVEDQGVGNDHVHGIATAGLALAHAVADHLAAAELDFVAVNGAVFLHLDPQFGIGQAHAVAGGGAEHLRIGLAGHGFHDGTSRSPITRPLKPNTRRLPA